MESHTSKRPSPCEFFKHILLECVCVCVCVCVCACVLTGVWLSKITSGSVRTWPQIGPQPTPELKWPLPGATEYELARGGHTSTGGTLSPELGTPLWEVKAEGCGHCHRALDHKGRDGLLWGRLGCSAHREVDGCSNHLTCHCHWTGPTSLPRTPVWPKAFCSLCPRTLLFSFFSPPYIDMLSWP